MISFILIASVMVLTALAFLLPPLLRKQQSQTSPEQSQELNIKLLRDQMQELEKERIANSISEETFIVSKLELERRAAEEIQIKTEVPGNTTPQKKFALGLGIAIPMIAVALYLSFGDRDGLNPSLVAAADSPTHEVGEEQIAAMVSGLAERLQKDPNNPDGWYMLARSYNTLKRFDKAVEAFAQLNKLIPNNADLLADYGDTLAMTQNQSLQGAPEKLIDQALSIDPKNIKALSLSGSAAFERREYRQAITQWKKILVLLPADANMAKVTLGNIGEAQGLLGETPDANTTASVMQKETPANDNSTPAPASNAAARLSGTVDIDGIMRSKVNDTDPVFIFARDAQGSRMPLVVLRKQVKDLPFKFTLDDSMSIAPNTHLADHTSLVIGARVSKNGNATPSIGDPEGLSLPVAPGASAVLIKISSEHQ